MKANLVVFLGIELFALLGCRQDASTGSRGTGTGDASGRGRTEGPEPPAAFPVTAERRDLIFSYQKPGSSEFATATSIDAVPEAARSSVVITDLSKTPEERASAHFIFVADLRTPRDDGTYPVAVASRYGFEAGRTQTSSATHDASGGVTVYSASWCGVCRRTKALLKEWGVPFVEKDVEASRAAASELAAKAQQQGVMPSGVPVIDVAGTLLMGLDETTLRSTLKQKGLL